MLIEPLHNLAAIPPISYVLPKLIHSYQQQLMGMSLDLKVQSVLDNDWCQYWPEYVNPPTTLLMISQGLGPSTYHPITLASSRSWVHPQLTHPPNPPKYITDKH